MWYNRTVQVIKQIGAERMANTAEDIERLRTEFGACRKPMAALGDETRQHQLFIMLGSECAGNRVIDIAAKTNLSRPAVSHHMQILKDAGIVKSRKEGTCIYYYLAPDDGEVEKMITLFTDIKRIMEQVPDKSGEEQ